MVVPNIRIKSCRIDEPNDNDKLQIIFCVDDKKQEKQLIKDIDNAWKEEGTGKPRNLPYFTSEASEEYPVDEDTGRTLFLANSNAEIVGKPFKVKLYDTKGNAIPADNQPSIGSGTIANLGTNTYVWTYKKDMGIKLNFNALQIVDLVEYSGGGESFGAVEGSYHADTFGGNDTDKPKKKKKKKTKTS